MILKRCYWSGSPSIRIDANDKGDPSFRGAEKDCDESVNGVIGAKTGTHPHPTFPPSALLWTGLKGTEFAHWLRGVIDLIAEKPTCREDFLLGSPMARGQ